MPNNSLLVIHWPHNAYMNDVFNGYLELVEWDVKCDDAWMGIWFEYWSRKLWVLELLVLASS
jgi:hypothetical protein